MGHKPILVTNIEGAIECIATAYLSGNHPTKDEFLRKAMILLCGEPWLTELGELLAQQFHRHKDTHGKKDSAENNGNYTAKDTPPSVV